MIHYNASSDKSRVSYDDSVAYATARGGRLATLTEVRYYLESNCTLYCTKPDCADGSFGVHQWVAVTTPRIPRIPCMGYSEPINYGNPEEVNDGKDWVQVGIGFGNDMGLSHSQGGYPSWGNLAGLRFHSSFVWITSSSPPPQPPALPPPPPSPPPPPELPPMLRIWTFTVTVAGDVDTFLAMFMGDYQARRTLEIARTCACCHTYTRARSSVQHTHRQSHTHT